MKIIGKILRDKYICEVSHTEIEKCMDLYYNKLDKLEVGGEINLGDGHDFRSDVNSALRETQSFIKSHEKVINSIFKGIKVMGKK